MPSIVFMNTQQHRNTRRAESAGAAPLLLIGLIAAVYVAVRIGLSYALLGH